MFKKALPLIMVLGLIGAKANASYEEAKRVYDGGGRSVTAARSIVRELLEDGLYFSTFPLVEKFLKIGKSNEREDIDRAIEILVNEMGVKQFEVLPFEQLEKSSSRTVHYILAKKYFRKGAYDKAISHVRKVPSGHSLYPFALFIEGSSYSILKDHDKAIGAFKECLDESTSHSNDLLEKQLEINHDYCLIGHARALYAANNFKDAELKYLDLPKSSFIWPEILFEEAWNSYNLGNYNRTLGKLVTYKSPFFEGIFNPEVDVLRALTYLQLCLWGDAKQIVDDFYANYEKESQGMRAFLGRHGRNYGAYYEQAESARKGQVVKNDLLSRVLKSITFESTYRELDASLERGREELRKVRAKDGSAFNKMLVKNIVATINRQKQIIGSYVRRKLVLKFAQLLKSFEYMSNIKLEVLARRKIEIYANDYRDDRKRGDIKYLDRNEKQYFWTFNGEFWADELGDYVFALGSECRR